MQDIAKSESPRSRANRKPRIDSRKLAKRNRLASLRLDILEGRTNQSELAKKYNCSPATISRNVRKVWESFQREDPIESRALATRAVRRLERGMELALDGYRESCQPVEETRTETRQEACQHCSGSGEPESGPCNVCDATGRTTVSVTSRKVVGQSGNPSFLSVFKGLQAEVNKLEGTISETKTVHEVKGQVYHDLRSQLESSPYAGADNDAVVKALIAFDELEQSRIIDSEIVEEKSS